MTSSLKEFEYEILNNKVNLYQRQSTEGRIGVLSPISQTDFKIGEDNLIPAIISYLEANPNIEGFRFTARSLKEPRVVHRGLVELNFQESNPSSKSRIVRYE